MPFPGTPVLPHLRLSWGGDLGTPPLDIWSNSIAFRIANGTAASAAELAQYADAVKANLSGLITAPVFAVSPAVSLRWIKAVWVLNTGKQRDQDTAMYEFPQPVRGGGAAVPWTQSYAITFRTNVKRGRGSAGRIFPPACGPMPEGDTPYAPAQFVNNYALNFASTLRGLEVTLNDVLNDPNRTAFQVIVSRGTAEKPEPLLTDVQAVVMDRVADVQHRRTNRVPRLEGNRQIIPG